MARKGLNVLSNKNSSKNKPGLNSQLIIDVDYKENFNYENLENSKLIENLINEKIITNFYFDRVDSETKIDHYHFYFNKINYYNDFKESEKLKNLDEYKSLKSIFKDYIENDIINIEKIKNLKGKIMKNNENSLIGVIDNTSSKFKINDDLKVEIEKINLDDVYLLKKNSKNEKIEMKVLTSEGKIERSIGMGGFNEVFNFEESKDKDIKGNYDFEIKFENDIESIDSSDLEILKSEIVKILNNYNNGNVDLKFLELDLKKYNQSIKINFNNLLKSSIDHKIFMISKANIKMDLEEAFLKFNKYLKNEKNIDVKTNSTSFYFYKKDDFELKVLKKENKELKIEIDNKVNETKKAFEYINNNNNNNNIIEDNNNNVIETNSKEIEALKVEILDVENLVELKNNLIIDLEKLESVKNLIDITNKKIEIENKILIIDDELNKKNSIEFLESKILELEKNVESLKNDNETLNKNLDRKKNTIENLTNKIIELDNEIVLYKDLENKIVDLELLNNLNVEEIKTKDESIKSLESEIETKDESIKTKDASILKLENNVDKLKNDNSILKNDNDDLIKDNSILKLDNETLNKDIKVKDEKYNELYVDFLEVKIENIKNFLKDNKENLNVKETKFFNKIDEIIFIEDKKIEDLEKIIEEFKPIKERINEEFFENINNKLDNENKENSIDVNNNDEYEEIYDDYTRTIKRVKKIKQ